MNSLTSQESNDIAQNGIAIFFFPDGIVGSITDLFSTLALFVGPWQEEQGVAFLQKRMEVTFQPRPNAAYAKINKNMIKSGDYLAIRKWTGGDIVIMMGTGSMTGHTAMCQWIDGHLYVLESRGGTNGDNGVVSTPWDEWLEYAYQSNHDVALLPVSLV